ncbi:TRAP transporter permease [Desulfoscipio geothermicus]|uniref:TRAP transporter, 4TM/12TM fusion protein n=1 Tax=Desulfoscipio geothermicus DSM 3669 TaxID=1121426 RepID=A0A1I6D4Q0_9FIRM|nr:TRAP transporter permease [Desulfoscipio geothermicus]SFR00464.1 TRAP transporter, 4TM/12TM fusion protein [Desulfoscipio geothermicus DSM 3669]
MLSYIQAQKIGRILLIINSIFALYTAGFGLLSATAQRGLHWLFLSVSLFILYQSTSKEKPLWGKRFSTIWNTLVLCGAFSSGIYLLAVWQDRVLKVGATPIWDTFMAVVMIVVVLEATRKTTGKFLMITALLFIAYSLLGPYFPAPLGHRGQSLERLVNFLYFTTEGIFGIPMGISATFIIVFVLFGSFLEKFGGGKWFIDISYALTGRFRAGPAKTAVISSGLMGMLSGAPVANVATTGTFTIPLMKKVGFKSHLAGAIEAVASTGGMITPPIMGAGAFIMAEYLNIPYTEVAAAAIIPAFLFYFSLMLGIDSKAVKEGIVGIEAKQLPKISDTIKKRGHLAIPLISLIGMILIGWSPMKAAFWSTILSILIAYVSPKTRPNMEKILQALENGSKEVISIAAACASAGIIVGVIAITGLGAKISYTLIELSNGSIIIALILTAIISIILGFGMPPTAVYIILVSILVPPLVELGVMPIAAHMFLFFFSTIAALTPPVAITSYAAAAIAKANPNRTGVASFRLGILAYIIPFMFVFSPSLLLVGTPETITLSILTSTIGVCCLVAGMEGFLFFKWGWITRVLLAISAFLFIDGGWVTDVTALTGVMIAFLIQYFMGIKRNRKVMLNTQKKFL